MLKKSFLSIAMLMLFINTLYCNIENGAQNTEQPSTEGKNQAANETTNQSVNNSTDQSASSDANQNGKLNHDDLFLQLDDSGIEHSQPVQCKKDVLKVFGFLDLTLDESRSASPFEKSYCTTNTSTCCTHHDFKLANYTFVEGKKEIVQIAYYRRGHFNEGGKERKKSFRVYKLASLLPAS